MSKRISTHKLQCAGCQICVSPTKSEECVCLDCKKCHPMCKICHQPKEQEWEEELFRLASLVGTDAMNPKENLLNYVNELLSSQKQNLIREVEKMLIPESGHTGDELMHYEEGYSDAMEDILSLLKGESR